MVSFEILSGYFFTGLGVATGSAFTELWIKPHMIKLKEKGKKINWKVKL